MLTNQKTNIELEKWLLRDTFVTLYQVSLSKIYFTPAVNFSVLREWILKVREGRSEIKISFTLLRSEMGNETPSRSRSRSDFSRECSRTHNLLKTFEKLLKPKNKVFFLKIQTNSLPSFSFECNVVLPPFLMAPFLHL